MKSFAVFVQDDYGAKRLLWFDDRGEMVNAYNGFLHLIAQGKGVREAYAFELCAGETAASWQKAMGNNLEEVKS